jgi:integrase/recombinase XerD
LRVSEAVGLNVSNLKVGSGRPYIEIPARIAKRKKPRRVPLWWDGATLADLQLWKAERERQGAGPSDPFVCAQAKGTRGKRLSARNAQARFKKCLKPLGPERVAVLSIHSGRHSYCSHALAGGRTLAEVRDAAGHANISTTSIYLHVVHDDDDAVGSLFDFQ